MNKGRRRNDLSFCGGLICGIVNRKLYYQEAGSAGSLVYYCREGEQMTTSLKDVSSAQMIKSMAELGCFEYEDTAYGCAFRKDGKTLYRMGGDWQRIHDFVESSRLAGLMPTAAAEKTVRQAKITGSEEEAKLKLKLALGKELQTMYDTTFFDLLEELGQTPNCDSAGEILEAYKEEIDGFFNAGQLQLFEGLLNMAYLAKTLTTEHFEALRSWLYATRMQMADDVLIKKQFNRTFNVYIEINDQGVVRQVSNANRKPLEEQKWAAERKGFLTSPVYAKTRWYEKAAELSNERAAFQEEVRQLMDERYIERLKALRSLPAVIDAELFAQKLAIAEEACSPAAMQQLKDYGRLWNIFSN